MSKPEHPDFPIDPETGRPGKAPEEVGSDVGHRVVPDRESFAETFERDVLTKLDRPEDLLRHDDIVLTIEELGLEGDVNVYEGQHPEVWYYQAIEIMKSHEAS